MRNPDIPTRLIPCLDVDKGRVVKGVKFKNLKDAGDPIELGQRYEAEGGDELMILDISASNENRSTVVELTKEATRNIFVPVTIGGGIKSVKGAQDVLDSGADNVAVNSAAVKDPKFLPDLSFQIGKQSLTLAIDAKRNSDESGWEVYIGGGKYATGIDAIAWAKEGARSAGQILLTSKDRDGTNSGFDIELLKAITAEVDIPVIASGGAGLNEHYSQAIKDGKADAVLGASTLHWRKLTIPGIKNHLSSEGIIVRPVPKNKVDFKDLDLQEEKQPLMAIVNYGMGNRSSVAAALDRVGAKTIITNDPEEIILADGLILPGVGAFPAAMERLKEGNLIPALNKFRELGKPILAICLGLQLLFEKSEEYEETEGLGWIKGSVTSTDTVVQPNIGWRFVDIDQQSPLTQDLSSQALFYHAHEFAARPVSNNVVKGISNLGRTALGHPSSAVSVVQNGLVFGTQFHPEKSSYDGLQVLRNFVKICRSSI